MSQDVFHLRALIVSYKILLTAFFLHIFQGPLLYTRSLHSKTQSFGLTHFRSHCLYSMSIVDQEDRTVVPKGKIHTQCVVIYLFSHRSNMYMRLSSVEQK